MPEETKTHRILRLILYLSNNYPKTKGECVSFLGIKDSAFYNYRNVLLDTGFDLHQKEGRYWIDFTEGDHHVLRNLLHFSEEEAYMISRSIDMLEEDNACSIQLKHKLTSFLNQDEAIETYIHKEKSVIVKGLYKARKEKKQVLLINYASGNSQTIKNRMVEPFEFKDDFNLVWAFDTDVKKNRQFKICRMDNVQETPFSWEFQRLHRSSPVDVFRNTGELTKRVEFELNLRARNLLAEEYPLSEKYISAISPNRFLFKSQVAKYEGPGRFVLGISEDIRLIGDGGFMDFVKEKIKKYKHFLGTV